MTKDAINVSLEAGRTGGTDGTDGQAEVQRL